MGAIDSLRPKHLLATHPGPDWPALQLNPMPWAPTAFRELVFIENLLSHFKIDEHEIGVIVHFDSSLANQIPNTRGSFAHPMHNLLDGAVATIDLIQQQGQRVFDRWESRG